MENIKRKYGLAFKVFLIVLLVVALKFIVRHYALEFIGMTSLFTTIVGGAIFLIGFILAGTIADYKESEKMPSELTASFESLYQEGVYLKKLKPEFDFNAHKKRIENIIFAFQKDLSAPGKKKIALTQISKLSESMIEMDKLGASASVARVRSEQTNLNKTVLRAYQIKETSFIPAAYAIVEIIATCIVVFLIFLKLDPFFESLAILTVVVYILVYMVLFIKDVDDPFEGTGGSADVDMFLVDEFAKNLKKNK